MSDPDGDPDYVVIRPGPGLPEGFLPSWAEGVWLDRSMFPPVYDVADGPPAQFEGRDVEGVAWPSGRFEVDEHGNVAEVWEIRL